MIIILHAKGTYTQRILYMRYRIPTFVRNSSHSSVINIETKFDRTIVDRREIYPQLLRCRHGVDSVRHALREKQKDAG